MKSTSDRSEMLEEVLSVLRYQRVQQRSPPRSGEEHGLRMRMGSGVLMMIREEVLISDDDDLDLQTSCSPADRTQTCLVSLVLFLEAVT